MHTNFRVSRSSNGWLRRLQQRPEKVTEVRATRHTANSLGLDCMTKSLLMAKVLLFQHAGFLAIIVLCYLNELLKLPSLLFSEHPFAFTFSRSTVEMLFILGVWLLVNSSTRRLLKYVQDLEAFMRVCAWCRRIDHKGEWMPLEKFMLQGFDTPTTHGICPECLRQQKGVIERAKSLRRIESQASLPKTSG